jgi:hypothetical protein
MRSASYLLLGQVTDIGLEEDEGLDSEGCKSEVKTDQEEVDQGKSKGQAEQCSFP